MKKTLVLFCLTLFILVVSVSALDTTTIVLQNGLDTYYGCTDAHMVDTDKNKNFGASTVIEVKYQKVTRGR